MLETCSVNVSCPGCRFGHESSNPQKMSPRRRRVKQYRRPFLPLELIAEDDEDPTCDIIVLAEHLQHVIVRCRWQALMTKLLFLLLFKSDGDH